MRFEDFHYMNELNEMSMLFSSGGVKQSWDEDYLLQLQKKVKGKTPTFEDEIDEYHLSVYETDKKQQVILIKDDEDEIVVLGTLVDTDYTHLKGSRFGGISKRPHVSSSVIEDLYDIVLTDIAKHKTMIADDLQSYGGKSIWKRFLKNNHDFARLGVYNIKDNKIQDEYDENETFDEWYKRTSEYVYGGTDGKGKDSEKFVYFVED